MVTGSGAALALTSGLQTAFECRDLCKNYSGCNMFNWNRANGDCLLRDETVYTNVHYQYISGPPDCANPTVFTYP